MLPAYALAAVLFVVWLFVLVTAGRLHVGRLVAGLAIGPGTLVLAVSIALPIALPEYHFPKPKGPYATGSVTYHWVDAAMTAEVVQAGLWQPCLWITRPASDMRLERSRSGGWPEYAIAETLTTMRAVFDKHRPGSAYWLDMPGMFHVNFTDVPSWSPLTPQPGLTGPVEGKRMWDIVNEYSLAFFDEYLKGRREPLLDARVVGYPEVRLERRGRL